MWVGSTGLTVVISERDVYLGHIGDSRAVLVKDGDVVHASTDHRAKHAKERSRIVRTKSKIIGGMIRTQTSRGTGYHYLSISRAFGDFGHKSRRKLPREKQAVICTPDVCSFSRSDIDFVVLATDGLFTSMDNEEVASFIHDRVVKEKMSPRDCAIALVRECLDNRKSEDNVTITIVRL